ncbi:culC [Symbiodinium microadriaticum]|nr:culC [Symbiodinium microadriaticum]
MFKYMHHIILSACVRRVEQTVKDGDVFTFNALFTSKLRRVKIPLVVLKDGGGSGSCNGGGSGGGGGGGYADMVLGDGLGGVPAAVEEDRRHMVEATIVRIMKARKTLGHNELVAEAMRQCAHRFTPDAQSVKKRIESLIEREYLQRDANDRKKYNYLA